MASNIIELYGRPYPKGTLNFAVELDCYRHNWGPADGGLGAEQHFRNAWKIFWPDFQWNQWCDLMLWAWCNYKYIVVIGHSRASKTYTFGHVAYLDYCAMPLVQTPSGLDGTLTSMATVTLDGLRLRMWADFLRAVETSKVPHPFTIRSTKNECRLFPTEHASGAGERYQVQGMSIQRTDDAAGRIRGGHAGRRRIFLDEAQDISDAIYDTLDNPMSAPDAKCVMLTNPVERVSRFGEWCEPEGGWGSITDSDLFWKLKKGRGQGICLHFDGRQSPNVKAGKTIFPYMLTQDTIDEIVTDHGENSLPYWSRVIGFFPPDGVVAKIFPASVIDKARAPIPFDFAPQKCATLDPAFEQDDCVMHFADLGMPVFGQKDYKISATETLVCKIDVGPSAEPKDFQVAHWVMDECRRRGVQPQHFIMDRTGGGRGVFAILQKEWSRDVQGIDYGGSATERNLRGDDSRRCCDLYQWFVTELWFRAAECCKAGLLGGLDRLHSRTVDDLSSRRYNIKQGTKGALTVAESKVEVKKRLDRSPDYGDAFVQFGELLIRLGTVPGGGPLKRLQAGRMWDKARAKALRASNRFNEAAEFTY